jgi:DNA modification methylase
LNIEDVNWYAGDSNEVLDEVEKEVDFVMSCPPYADLEKYMMTQRIYLIWIMLISKRFIFNH